MANDEEDREIVVNKEDSIRIKTIVFVISCIVLVITIPILMVQANKNQLERSKTEKTRNETNGNGSISETAAGTRGKHRSNIHYMSEEGPCRCRPPFHQVGNCAFCFYIPSYIENNFVRLEQFTKQAATKKCVDELEGELPSSM